MQKIVMLSETFSPETGWGTVADALAKEAEKARWQVVKVASDKTGDSNTPRVYSLADPLWKRWLSAWHWWAWIGHQDADLVHIVTEPQFWLATLTSKPCIGTVHGTYALADAHKPFWAKRQFKKGMDRLTRIISVSEHTAQRIMTDWRSKVRIIPNGINPAILHEPRKAIDWQSRSQHRILCVGAIKKRKGCLELAEGFAEFIQAYPDAALAFVGPEAENGYTETLRSTIDRLGLSEKIAITGLVSREELMGWYDWCHVMALLPISGNKFEGFGLVYLEANVFGKPVLGVKGTAAEEAVSEETGVLIEGTDPERVRFGLEKIFNDYSVFRFDSWLAEHSWEKIFGQYAMVYRSLISKLESGESIRLVGSGPSENAR